jgi:hypothetical protein
MNDVVTIISMNDVLNVVTYCLVFLVPCFQRDVKNFDLERIAKGRGKPNFAISRVGQ